MTSVIQIAASGDEENLSNSETDEFQNAKKLKTIECDSLEERLNGILCCAVCLDLPKSAVYQVIYFLNFSFNLNTLYFSLKAFSLA